jgi:hypothetical protein
MGIRPNRVIENSASHARKAVSVKAIWPEVAVIPWDLQAAPCLSAGSSRSRTIEQH